jgi:hypothetical protein
MALIPLRLQSSRYWVGGNVISGAAAGAIAEALYDNPSLRILILGEHAVIRY